MNTVQTILYYLREIRPAEWKYTDLIYDLLNRRQKMEHNLINSINGKYHLMYGLNTPALQKNFLDDLITLQKSGSGFFIVYGMEAGAGKSIETNKIVGKYIKYGGLRKFLVVKKFKEDVIECANAINKESGILNAAIGITGDEWRGIRIDPSFLIEYQVIVITHKRYMDLSTDIQTRMFYETDRHTVIIDEQIDIPTYTFSKDSFGKVIGSLPDADLMDKVMQISKPIMNVMTECKMKNNQISICRPAIDVELLKQLQREITANINDITNKDDIYEFLNTIDALTFQNSLYNNGQLSVGKPHAKLWGLQNNIILDANAGIDMRYDCAPDVKEIILLPKVIDHSRTKLHPIIFNSSKRSMSSTKNYQDIICSNVSINREATDKTLIVTNKASVDVYQKLLHQYGITNIDIGDDYNGQNVAIAYFGDFLGKNHWRNFNQIWITVTNNWPMEAYPLNWSFFSHLKIVGQDLRTCGKKNKHGFLNPEIENIRYWSIVSDIYQACKRINRDGSLKSDIFIVNGDMAVINAVAEQFLNIHVEEPIGLENIQFKDKKVSKRKKDTNLMELVKYIMELQSGEYRKKEIYKKLGWEDGTNFSRYIKEIIEQQLIPDVTLINYHHYIELVKGLPN